MLKPDTINSKRNNCVLVALREVSNLPDEAILSAVRKHGYREDKGMYQGHYHAAAQNLGLLLGETVRPQAFFPAEASSGHVYSLPFRKMTINKVLPHLSKGVYFLRVEGHVMVVRDGRLVDHNWSKASLRRRVLDVTQVLNAYVPPVKGYVKCVRSRGRRAGVPSWHRYEAMKAYLKANPETTPEQLVSNSPYLKADVRWDLKRGNIIII